LEDMGDMPNYNDWIVSQFSTKLVGRTAEIGAGLGTISERLRPFVDQLDLIEPTQVLAERLREKFAGDERCTVTEQTLESWINATPDEIYNAIVMVNVLEHIEDDQAAARGLFATIKPGGKLLIFVPALPLLYSELDRIYGHFRRYRQKDLRKCIETAGFRIERLRYFDITGVFPWWLLNTVIGKTSFHQPSLTVYDKILVPPTRLFESIMPPPLGKNLILIASKD
ncbi:MAG: class I SAM-dependent methyltransferase, partial [Alphaproteobacteria bacterium]